MGRKSPSDKHLVTVVIGPLHNKGSAGHGPVYPASASFPSPLQWPRSLILKLMVLVAAAPHVAIAANLLKALQTTRSPETNTLAAREVPAA
jgi:hypothetical protein